VSGSNLVPIYQALQHYEGVMHLGGEEQLKAACAVLSKCNNWYVKKDKKLQDKKKLTKTAATRSQVVGAVTNEAIQFLKTYDATFYSAVQSYHIRKNAVKQGTSVRATQPLSVGYVNERESYLSFGKTVSMAGGFVHEAFTKNAKGFKIGGPSNRFYNTFQDTFSNTDFEHLTVEDWRAIHQMANELDGQKISTRYMKKFERMNYMLESDGNAGLRFVVGGRSAQGDGWPYAMDEWGSIYTANHRLDTSKKGNTFFNHSSFTAGDVVVCAGELCINAQGRLAEIDNSSGHYKPTAAELRTVLIILRDEYGVDITATKVSVNTATSHQEWNSAATFLAGAQPDLSA
jgi:hypothetical protein